MHHGLPVPHLSMSCVIAFYLVSSKLQGKQGQKGQVKHHEMLKSLFPSMLKAVLFCQNTFVLPKMQWVYKKYSR